MKLKKTESENKQSFEEMYIQGLFEELYIAWANKKGPRGGLHASSILQSDEEYCAREHVLGSFFEREVSKHDSHLNNIFLNGWLVHEYWQELFSQDFTEEEKVHIEAAFSSSFEEIKDLSYEKELQNFLNLRSDKLVKEKTQTLFSQVMNDIGAIADEVEQSHYAEEWGLSFTPDAIVQIRKKKTFFQKYIVEIKGYNHTAYLDILSRVNPMENQEFKKAAVQANLYMHMLGIDKAIILIEDKGTQQFRIWVRSYDITLVEKYIDRLNKLKLLISIYKKSKKLLPRICATENDERAKKCPLRKACFSSVEQRELFALK